MKGNLDIFIRKGDTVASPYIRFYVHLSLGSIIGIETPNVVGLLVEVERYKSIFRVKWYPMGAL